MAKWTVNINHSIDANASNVDVLSGLGFKNAYRTGVIGLWETAAAVGLNAEFKIADRTAMESSPVPATNAPINYMQDLAVDDVVVHQGEVMSLFVTNTTAAAITFQAKLILDNSVVIQ